MASLFQQMQALAGGALGDAGFGAGLTGQNLPVTSQSAATSPLSLSPSSQFASNVLGALINEQANQPQAIAGDIISALNPGGSSLGLGQVEQALTGSASSSASPQALGIASAFSQLDANGDGQISQPELAQALQSLQSSDPLQGMFRHHHRHRHHVETSPSDAQTTAATSSADTASTADASTDAATQTASA